MSAHVMVRRSLRAMGCLVFAIATLAACGRTAASSARLIVSNESDGTITVIDPRSRDHVATIPVGKRPRGLRVSQDGDTLYVALSGSPKAGPGVDESTLPPRDRAADGIGVVDLDKLALVATIPGGQDPESFDLAGDVLVVSNEETAEASIVDLESRRIRAYVPCGGEPEGVATSPDGSVWITSELENTVAVIDPRAARVVAKIATGMRPRGIAFTPDGALALVTGENDASVTVIDARAHKAITKIALPAGSRPMGIVVSRDGKRAYVTTGRGGAVAAIDLVARTAATLVGDVGARPWGIALAHDGLLYTANGPSNDVSVIDSDDGRVVAKIPTGGSPWGVVLAPE